MPPSPAIPRRAYPGIVGEITGSNENLVLIAQHSTFAGSASGAVIAAVASPPWWTGRVIGANVSSVGPVPVRVSHRHEDHLLAEAALVRRGLENVHWYGGSGEDP